MAVLVLIVAGVLALVGKKEIDKGRVVVPAPQVGLRQDVQAVTNSLREGLATDAAASGPTDTAPAGPAFGQN